MADTIPALFFRQAAAQKDETLFLVKRHGAYVPISWRQAADDIAALATFLLDRHVHPDDRILILSENRPEWGQADIAIQSIGAWSVPVYPSLTAQDLQVICADCQPALCIASSVEQSQKLLHVMARVPSIQAILLMDGAATQDPRVIPWPEALAHGHAHRQKLQGVWDQRLSDLQPRHTATLIYTSGTTGEPKGVMLSHENFLSNVAACLQVIPIHGQDIHLSFLPLSHVFERMAGWYLMLSVGAVIAYAENMDTIPHNMMEVRPTIMLGVPRFFEKLYSRIQEALRQSPPSKQRIIGWALGVGRQVLARRSAGKPLPVGLALRHRAADVLVFKQFRAKLGGRLRFFVSGSAPLAKEIGEFFCSVGVMILEGYGLTETSPVIAVNRLPMPRFGSVGPLIPGVEVRIADDGEILTRGPHVMQGYYNKPQVTAEMIVDGWLHTGDIGHLDEEGRLYITDRKKDLIKTAGGKFVAPQKLENLFVTDPYIAQAFVYGDKQPYCVVLIVPNMEQLRRYAQEQEIGALSVKELVRDARVQAFYWGRVQARQAGLASFEQVKKIALLDQEFSQASGELTPTMKAKRSLIAQRHAAILQQLYA
jgi:long-chain acyl-CoA synthetase